jgi:hypothetical protein
MSYRFVCVQLEHNGRSFMFRRVLRSADYSLTDDGLYIRYSDTSGSDSDISDTDDDYTYGIASLEVASASCDVSNLHSTESWD